MKVVLAFDSFKGSLGAAEICAAVSGGIREVIPDGELVERPMADGGEGTASVMVSARAGEWIPVEATGPLPDRRVIAGFGWFPDSRTAIVEMASASGLVLLTVAERNPMETTTVGTGELLAAAARHGAERVLLAVGGSATVDGGVGAASALGWSPRGRGGEALPPVGGTLRAIRDLVREHPIELPPIDVLCDVTNPLLGPRGAAAVYGPQKGATPDQVIELERGLSAFADAVERATGIDIRSVPGGGASGGLAAGAYGLLGARLTSGATTVLEAVAIPEALRGADWILTGEGRFDGQSAQGKVVSAVAAAGRRASVRVGVIAGSVEVADSDWASLGIDAAVSSTPPGMPLESAMAQAGRLLREAGAAFARDYLLREST